MKIKVLSVIQPWASLIAVGAKKVETRSWKTYYRGTLGIHASANFPVEARAICMEEPFYSTLRAAGFVDYGIVKRSANDLPLGAIIATVDLVDCRWIPIPGFERVYTGGAEGLFQVPGEPERSFGNYVPLWFAWIFENLKVLPEPIPAKGRQKLWDYEI